MIRFIKHSTLALMTLFLLHNYCFSLSSKENKLITTGNNYIMKLKWKEARSYYSKLIKLNPNHPVGYFYMSYTYFYSNIDSGFSEDDKIKFRHYVIKGNLCANNSNTNDKVTSLYILAMKCMNAYLNYLSKNYIKTISMGFEILKELRQLCKKYPNFIDLKIGLGIYHMVLSRLPKNFKKMLSIFNLKGSAILALKYLKLVSEKGNFFKHEASALLAFYNTFVLRNLLKGRRQYARLITLFPENYKFQENFLYTFYLKRQFTPCLTLIASQKKELTDNLKVAKKLWDYRFDFLKAKIYFEQKKFKKSIKLFQRIIKLRKHNWIEDFHCVYSILYRGMIYDVTNKREKALFSYKLITLNVPNSFSKAKRRAKSFINKKFMVNDPRIYRNRSIKSIRTIMKKRKLNKKRNSF